ncbi:hypothetical protein ACFYXH_41830 [Streptomyces sp. NPDC002730]|uniref:hypothetical protein n=1 Tax=Streptomyces sp. NPDC002730 TaxID=3364662 RepID=UPI0036951108
MGTVITAAAQAAPQTGYAAASSVQLAAQAARQCLTDAGLTPDEVGVLINVGVYRESNMMEPAMAALVQKEVGINLDYLARPVPGAGFSFDLMNGACGVLNAVQVAQGILGTGGTSRILVTAADVHPGGRADQDRNYPYADLGAALLLERSVEPGSGFGPVRVRGADGPVGAAGYLDAAVMGTDGRREITVRRDPDWTERLLELAAGVVGDYVREEGVALDRTFVVCNEPAVGFGAELAERLGVDSAAVVAVGAEGRGEPHTAALVLGYLQVLQSGLPEGYEEILFVCAGAGLSAACSRYRPAGAVRA